MITRSPSKTERESTSPKARALRIWEASFELALAIFKIADRLPQEIAQSLGTQMRIVALSIPAHIARGQSGPGSRELHRGLCQARGALSVLKSKLSSCAESGYAAEAELLRADGQIRETSRRVDEIIAEIRETRGVGGIGTGRNGAGGSRFRDLAAAAAAAR